MPCDANDGSGAGRMQPRPVNITLFDLKKVCNGSAKLRVAKGDTEIRQGRVLIAYRLNDEVVESEASSRPGPRQSCVRALLQFFLVVSEKENARDGHPNRGDQQQQADRTGHAFHLLTEQVGASSEQ